MVPHAQTINDQCSPDVLMSYYPERFVAETLDRFEVPQENRDQIISALAEKNKEVVPLVEEKAAKKTPNPLRDPQYRQEAVTIFRETLYELFSSVMQANGINNQEQIQSMLDDIQQQKAKQFAECMERFESEGPEESTFTPEQREDLNTEYNEYPANY